jgi:hypothetical protein
VADINRYSQASSLSGGDQIVVWSTENGDTRKASLTQLKAFTTPGDTGEATQYSAPSATGFTATIAESTGRNVWLYLTPGAGYAAGTIVLPSATNSVHGQEIVVSCTQSVGTLTVTSSGGTVTGAPSSLSANGFFRLKFEQVTKTWQRVG